MPFKACNAFVTDREVFIFTESVTPRGAALSMGPYFRVDLTADAAVLGATVLEALAASVDGVPHPDDIGAVTREMLRFTEDRSWRNFAERVKGHAAVAFDGREILITPHQRGPKHSFLTLEDRTIRCAPEATAIGNAVMAMLGPGGSHRLGS